MHEKPPTYQELADTLSMLASAAGTTWSGHAQSMAHNAKLYSMGIHIACKEPHECPQCAGPVPPNHTWESVPCLPGYTHTRQSHWGGAGDYCIHCRMVYPRKKYAMAEKPVCQHDFTYIRNREKECKHCGYTCSVPRNKSVPHAARPINIGPKYCEPNAHNKVARHIQGKDVEVCTTCGLWWQYSVPKAYKESAQEFQVKNEIMYTQKIMVKTPAGNAHVTCNHAQGWAISQSQDVPGWWTHACVQCWLTYTLPSTEFTMRTVVDAIRAGSTLVNTGVGLHLGELYMFPIAYL